MQSFLALRLLVKREIGGARGRLMNIYIHHVFSKGNILHADVSEDRLPLQQRDPLV